MQYVDDNKRHCASCEKVITDFTQMSDEQLIAHFKNNASSCGMFAPHQLNRQLQAPKKKQSGWLKALVVPALLAMTEADAQDVKPVPTTEQTADSAKPRITVPLDDVFHTLKDTLIVSGMVLEIDDSLGEQPLIDAIVRFHISDSIKPVCVVDRNGLFEIKLPHLKAGDTVKTEVIYPGYGSYFLELVLKVDQRNVIKILPGTAAIPTDTYLRGDVNTVVTTPCSRLRSFFRRLFRPRSW